jgi:hypothetical protein
MVCMVYLLLERWDNLGLCALSGENDAKKKWEGRKVGIDFFRGPKGPPDDLRKEKDEYPGRFGLASEYAGDRNLVNPWEW